MHRKSRRRVQNQTTCFLNWVWHRNWVSLRNATDAIHKSHFFIISCHKPYGFIRKWFCHLGNAFVSRFSTASYCIFIFYKVYICRMTFRIDTLVCWPIDCITLQDVKHIMYCSPINKTRYLPIMCLWHPSPLSTLNISNFFKNGSSYKQLNAWHKICILLKSVIMVSHNFRCSGTYLMGYKESSA